jgi:hypothetical protein
MHEASLALSLHLYFVVNPKSGGIAEDSPGAIWRSVPDPLI